MRYTSFNTLLAPLIIVVASALFFTTQAAADVAVCKDNPACKPSSGNTSSNGGAGSNGNTGGVMPVKSCPPGFTYTTPKPTIPHGPNASPTPLPGCYNASGSSAPSETTCSDSSYEYDTATKKCLPKPVHTLKCKDNEVAKGGVCVDVSKRNEQINSKLVPLIGQALLKEIYIKHHRNSCPEDGDSICKDASFDDFKNKYFANVIYECAFRLQQRLDELGGTNTNEKQEIASCLSYQYNDLSKEAILEGIGNIEDGKFSSVVSEINKGTEHAPEIVAPPEEAGTKDDSTDACTENIDGIGWLVCPILSATSKAADGALEILKHYLNIPPKILDTSSPTYEAWSYFRNIANALFVVIFLWVIFSQITGSGINNYGIKRLLPRLLAGVILVNVSFYISQIAVDISNILGYSIEDMLEQATTAIGGGSSATSATWQDTLWVLVGVGAAVAVAVAILLLGQSLVLVCLLAVAITMCIIIARQAIVVLLVVCSPIAFAAWLLPNTESVFRKWLSLLKSMLILFPLVALIYGGGGLASHILMQVATSDPTNTNEFLQLAALAVAFLPLASTPMALRSSMNGLGALGGMINNTSSAAGKTRTNIKDSSRLGEAWKGMKFNRQLKKAERRGRGRGIGGFIDRSSFGKKFGLDRGAYAAQEAADKAAEENAERKLAYEYKGDAASALKDGDARVRTAAVKQLASKGEWGANQLATYLSNGGKVDSIAMANHLTTVKSAHAGVAEAGTEALRELQRPGGSDTWQTDKTGMDSFTVNGIQKLTDAQVLSQSSDAIKTAVENAGIDASRASRILSNPELGKDIADNKRVELQKAFTTVEAEYVDKKHKIAPIR